MVHMDGVCVCVCVCVCHPLVTFFALRRDIGIVKYIFIQRLRGLAKIKFGGWRTHTCAGAVTHTTVMHTTDAHIHVQAQ